MTTVNVRYFASIREALGASERVELPVGATLATLRDVLIARSPVHAAALARGKALRCALDQTLCEESALVGESAEVAFFPPVTGG
jgi:molybdopterin synthase sulfur carrier subunit